MENRRHPRIPVPRATPAFALLFLLCAGNVSAAGGETDPGGPAWVERDVDRPGSDFRILWLRGGPEGCQEACAQIPQCRSYTYVRPGMPGRIEGCWLKDEIPPPVADGCCVSGVKTDETVSGILSRRHASPEARPAAPVPPPEPEIAPETPAGEPGSGPDDILATGSGIRLAAKVRFTANPPAAAGPIEAGKGKRRARGLRFVPVPPPARSSGPESSAEAKFRLRGMGLRKVEGARYTAIAPSGTHSRPDAPPPRGAKRSVRGVYITAVPPRSSGSGREGP